MPSINVRFLALPLLLAACAGGGWQLGEGNPLLGVWQLETAPGITWSGYRSLIFTEQEMLADARLIFAVEGYEVTPHWVRVRAAGGRTFSYRHAGGDRMCEEPAAPRAVSESRRFGEGISPPPVCYRKLAGADGQRLD